jgi:hypothetical protein
MGITFEDSGVESFPAFDATTWDRFAGRTVAVRSGRVIAVGDSVQEVWHALRTTPCPDPEDCDYVVWVPTQAATYRPRFAEWEHGARDLHREFNRRLRG